MVGAREACTVGEVVLLLGSSLLSSQGLWSILMVNCLPSMQVWNLSQAKTTERSYLFMLAYLFSASERDLEVKEIG